MLWGRRCDGNEELKALAPVPVYICACPPNTSDVKGRRRVTVIVGRACARREPPRRRATPPRHREPSASARTSGRFSCAASPLLSARTCTCGAACRKNLSYWYQKIPQSALQ